MPPFIRGDEKGVCVDFYLCILRAAISGRYNLMQ